VARIFGVDLRVHWTFWLLVILVLWSYSGSPRAMALGLAWIAVIFGSVIVHELAHCVVARGRGAVVKDILLMPLGGLSELDRMPSSAQDELAIAIVGPLTSFGLAALAALGGLALHVSLWPPTLFTGSWIARIMWLNVVLGAFNMLPALPMDGGRVLRASLARHRDPREATRVAVKVARAVALVMIAGGLVYDVWLVLIGLFVLFGSKAEEQAALAPDRRDESGGGDAPWTLPRDEPSARR